MGVGRLRSRALAAVGVAIAIAAASDSSALDCRDWEGLSPDDQIYLLEEEIAAILDSGAARSWNVNHRQIERCVLRRTRQISYEVDDVCAEGLRASMRAADEVVMRYVRSCVQ
jgi:hypothetical protein